DLVQLRLAGQPALLEQSAQSFDRVAAQPFLALLLRLIVAAIAARVTGAPVSEQLEEDGTSPVAAVIRRRAGRLVDGQDVVAVDVFAPDSVARGPVSDPSVPHHEVDPRGSRVLVVLADEDHRE